MRKKQPKPKCFWYSKSMGCRFLGYLNRWAKGKEYKSTINHASIYSGVMNIDADWCCFFSCFVLAYFPVHSFFLDVAHTDYLGHRLEEYTSQLPVPVHVLRTGKRSGLIRARLLGAQAVKGQVITFLDAHCECTQGWLQPLLARIVEDR